MSPIYSFFMIRKTLFYSDELESLIGNRGRGDGRDSAIGSPSGIDIAHENPSNYPGMV